MFVDIADQSNTTIFPHQPPSKISDTTKFLTIALAIIVFVSAFVILMFFSTTTKDIITMKKSTSINQTQSESLPYPCREPAIPYRKFLFGEFNINQVCLSDFVSEQWLEYLQTVRSNVPLRITDFRNMILPIFRALRTFCNIVSQETTNRLMRFHSDHYISNHLVSPDVFMIQMQISIQDLISSVQTNLISLINAIHMIVEMNSLYSAVNVAMFNNNSSMTQSISYANCTCGDGNFCIIPATFFNTISNQMVWTMPGMYSGCYVFPALAGSTLECLYDQFCLNTLLSQFNSSMPVNPQPLNASITSRFTPTSTVAELVIVRYSENWNFDFSYEAYRDACYPLEYNGTVEDDSYTTESKKPVISTVTNAIGVAGGLLVILQLFLSIGIKLGQTKKTCSVLDTSKIDFFRYN